MRCSGNGRSASHSLPLLPSLSREKLSGVHLGVLSVALCEMRVETVPTPSIPTSLKTHYPSSSNASGDSVQLSSLDLDLGAESPHAQGDSRL